MDPQAALWTGIAFVPIAGLLFWGSRRSARRLHTMLETPTLACRDLPGLGASTVEVCGRAASDAPMKADLSGNDCVAFRSTIIEHWTTVETVRDSKGHSRRVTRHHSAVRYHNDRREAFDVVDESGTARVEPEGAEMELMTCDGCPPWPGSPACGISPQRLGGRLTYQEAMIPIGQPLYVLACVSDRHTLVKPETLGEPFLISYRTEKQLISGSRWAVRLMTGIAALLFVAGAALIGYGAAELNQGSARPRSASNVAAP